MRIRELNLEMQTPPMYLLSAFIETDPIGDYLSSNSKLSNNLSFREELYEPTSEDSHIWKGQLHASSLPTLQLSHMILNLVSIHVRHTTPSVRRLQAELAEDPAGNLRGWRCGMRRLKNTRRFLAGKGFWNMYLIPLDFAHIPRVALYRISISFDNKKRYSKGDLLTVSFIGVCPTSLLLLQAR